MGKLLLLTHEYYPHRGGIAKYCHGLLQYFKDDEYLVVTDQKNVEKNPFVIQKELVSTWMWPSWLSGFFAVQQIVRREKPAAILTPNILPLGTIAFCIRSFFGVPYIISVHGMDINLAIARHPFLTQMILRRASRIIANSNATKQIVDTLALQKTVDVITPSYDPSSLDASPERARTIARAYAGKKVILTVGRLVKRKGQDFVLQALPHVIKKFPEVYYIMIGQGPDEQYLLSLIHDLHLESYVEIKKDVADDALGAYYALATMFAMPTRPIGPDIEGYGIVYLEAAHFGLPIIAGSSGGEAEACGDETCALQVDGGDLGSVTDGILAILEDPEFGQFLGASGRKHLQSLPGWQEQAARLRALIQV